MTAIYAIGDVHGCLTALDALLARIDEHRAGREAWLLFLGDYVDRGPDSRGVLERVIATGAIALLGNHEDMMLGALEGSPGAEGAWLANGGAATMASYGAPTIEALRGAFPERHLAFLRSLRTCHESAACFFVHAGIDPARALADQSRHDPGSDHPGPFPKRIVHGHTPDPAGPEILPRRVNADTGRVRAARSPAW